MPGQPASNEPSDELDVEYEVEQITAEEN